MNDGPNALEGEFGLDVFGKSVVMSGQFADDGVLVPQTNMEKLGRDLFLNRGFEPTPRDEQSLVGLNILHGPTKLGQGRMVHRTVTRFDLNTNVTRRQAG